MCPDGKGVSDCICVCVCVYDRCVVRMWEVEYGINNTNKNKNKKNNNNKYVDEFFVTESFCRRWPSWRGILINLARK